jgi:NAD(P)-dependent dehydrogenase (short-subunit alcohol dehydrogenase family)
MKPQRSGTVISTASIAGFFTGYAPHVDSACEAAVVQLTRSAATELGEHGVRVNCICPGPIAIPIFGSAFGLPADQAEELGQKLKAVFATVQPIKRSADALEKVFRPWSDRDGAREVLRKRMRKGTHLTGTSQIALKNARRSAFSGAVRRVPSIRLKNSTVSSKVSRRPSCR